MTRWWGRITARARRRPAWTATRYSRQARAAEYLTEHFHEAPVWIVACLEHGKAVPNRQAGASIYPAVQNMLLAARALGLGCTLTARHLALREGDRGGAGPAARASIPTPSCRSAGRWENSAR